MEVKRTETAFDCYQLIDREVLRREERVDSVVPDTQPDIGTVLSTCGTPLIRSKDLSAGQMRVDANIPVKVVYLPEEGDGVYTLEVNIPVSAVAEHAEIGEDCLCTADIMLAALETRVLNPRKVTVRAELCIGLRCYRAECRRFFGAPELPDHGIQSLTKETSVSAVCLVTEKTFVLTDEYQLPAEQAGIAQLLCQKTVLETEELKTVGTRIVLKGIAKSNLLYCSPEGKIAAAAFTTEFSQIIEAGELPPNICLSACLLLSGSYYDPGVPADGHTVTLEMHLVAQVTALSTQSVPYLADAYSNCLPLTVQRTQQCIGSAQREATLRAALRESAETPVPVTEIVTAFAECGCIAVSGGEVTLTVTVQVFYRSTASLHCLKRSYPVRMQTELADGEWLEISNTTLQELYAEPGENGVELRLPAEVCALVMAQRKIDTVESISCDTALPQDLSEEPSLVLMRLCSEDDLWKIAKENHSTVEAIRDVNGLDALPVPWSRMLLIPKITE